MTDNIVVPINHIERKPGSHKYRIVGKGITVEFLAQFIDDPKWPVSRICENYGLTAGEVFAAWAFYSDHKEEIDRLIAEGEILLKDDPPNDEHRQTLQKRFEEKTNRTLK
jgi:uncharacterized protein (DUF433 family)